MKKISKKKKKKKKKNKKEKKKKDKRNLAKGSEEPKIHLLKSSCILQTDKVLIF